MEAPAPLADCWRASGWQARNRGCCIAAYLIDNGRVYVTIDLTCTDDDDAKRQTTNLSNGHDIEVWEGDRKVALLRSRRESFDQNFFGNA